jgi:hypothetical protein
VVIGVRKIVKNGCLSPTKLGDGRKIKPHKNQSLLHPPTHPACPPPRVGLPLASPSLTLGRQPKTGLQQQAQAVLTPPRQSQSGGFSPFGSSATPFVCLLFLKEILFCFLKKHLKKKMN